MSKNPSRLFEFFKLIGQLKVRRSSNQGEAFSSKWGMDNLMNTVTSCVRVTGGGGIGGKPRAGGAGTPIDLPSGNARPVCTAGAFPILFLTTEVPTGLRDNCPFIPFPLPPCPLHPNSPPPLPPALCPLLPN